MQQHTAALTYQLHAIACQVLRHSEPERDLILAQRQAKDWDEDLLSHKVCDLWVQETRDSIRVHPFVEEHLGRNAWIASVEEAMDDPSATMEDNHATLHKLASAQAKESEDELPSAKSDLASEERNLAEERRMRSDAQREVGEVDGWRRKERNAGIAFVALVCADLGLIGLTAWASYAGSATAASSTVEVLGQAVPAVLLAAVALIGIPMMAGKLTKPESWSTKARWVGMFVLAAASVAVVAVMAEQRSNATTSALDRALGLTGENLWIHATLIAGLLALGIVLEVSRVKLASLRERAEGVEFTSVARIQQSADRVNLASRRVGTLNANARLPETLALAYDGDRTVLRQGRAAGIKAAKGACHTLRTLKDVSDADLVLLLRSMSTIELTASARPRRAGWAQLAGTLLFVATCAVGSTSLVGCASRPSPLTYDQVVGCDATGGKDPSAPNPETCSVPVLQSAFIRVVRDNAYRPGMSFVIVYGGDSFANTGTLRIQVPNDGVPSSDAPVWTARQLDRIANRHIELPSDLGHGRQTNKSELLALVAVATREATSDVPTRFLFLSDGYWVTERIDTQSVPASSEAALAHIESKSMPWDVENFSSVHWCGGGHQGATAAVVQHRDETWKALFEHASGPGIEWTRPSCQELHDSKLLAPYLAISARLTGIGQ